MRNNIIASLINEMEKDDKIFFLTADMGINLVEQIQDKFPARFSNVGIAEQNMIGIAAGLANLGYKPFVYTISNFVIHRCFEQIRNDLKSRNNYDSSSLDKIYDVVREDLISRNKKDDILNFQFLFLSH